VLSLSDQIHNFLAEWEANQQMGKKNGIGEGECALCGRTRFVQYQIQVDASFCSIQCSTRYLALVEKGRRYAG
jgi:hypothetical protein